jgi:HK97 family phage portal protein
MGFLTRVSSVATPSRLRASWGGADDDRWFVPSAWLGAMSAAGVRVSPELAMTLSAVYCAVTTIADDIATMPCQFYKFRDDGGKDRIRSGQAGIGGLVYMLRYQPNEWQTAKDFWSMMIGHLLLRSNAYAEIIPGPSGFVDQLIPRHPDRVTPQRLPSGRVRYQVTRPGGIQDFVTQDEMFVLRDMSFDGLKGVSRTAYGAQALGSVLAAEEFAANFFRGGASASMAAIHKGGDLDEEETKALHTSISRYLSGVKNAGGLLVIEDDIELKDISIDPQKAQLLDTRERGIKEVARLFKFPGHKLEAEQQTQAYAAREQANIEYLMTCLRPIIVGIEQAIHRDLIIAKETFFAEFLMEALFRGDLKSRAEYYKTAIRNRWMTSNEVRIRENLNPIDGGDELCPWNTATAAIDGAEGGDAAHAGTSNARQIGSGRTAAARVGLRSTLIVHDSAVRVLRRERAAVEKLAKKYANDVGAWQAGLREFYTDHAAFIAQTMRLSMATARGIAAQHGAELEAQGIVVMDDAWERAEAEDLTALTLEPGVAA